MNVLTALTCPACRSAISADGLDLARGIATCSHCGALALLPAGARGTPAFQERPKVSLPPKVSVREFADGVELTLRWFSPVVWFLVFFVIAWDGFLVFWYSIALREEAPWIMAVFPIAHLAIGVGLTYFVVATFLNRTTVTATRDRLRVRHGPLPWLGNVELARDDVEQLYCKERVHRGKRSTSVSYDLCARVKSGPTVRVLRSASDAEQALYFEQTLERALGIRDEPVAGELPR
ncbi:MAG: hypothetical protein L6Q99_13130 [Planctomycetes bacterium]|nr:hypothetical protein [Planctomycetota bacterium]